MKMSFLYISSKMFFTPCLRLIIELWASRKLNNEASLCWASWGENDFYLQKKKVIFVQKALRSVSAVDKTHLRIFSISRIVPGLLPVFSWLKADMSIARVAKLCDVVFIFQLAYHWTRS